MKNPENLTKLLRTCIKHCSTHIHTILTAISQVNPGRHLPVTTVLSILTGQAQTVHSFRVLWAVPYPLILTAMAISQGVLDQKFLQARCPSCHLTNSIKAAKASTLNKDLLEYQKIWTDKVHKSGWGAWIAVCNLSISFDILIIIK